MLTVQQLWDLEVAQLVKERETTEPDPEVGGEPAQLGVRADATGSSRASSG